MKKNIFKAKHLFFYLLLFYGSFCFSIEKPIIRLGILPFGTVNWELAALKNAGLQEAQDFVLQIRPVANPQAGKIALLSGAVDIIISDWIWVSRQRSVGADFSFYPYSSTAGVLLVAANSPIQSLADLKHKQIGIAGGELDKNWLLLQALVLQQHHVELNRHVQKVFAAPPLLNQQMRQGRLDAMLNYWHYAARLEAEGYRQIIDGADIQKQLGLTVAMPTLGYVFKRSWADKHKKMLHAFLALTEQAKDLLCTSDAAWHNIIPLTKAPEPKTQQLLRQRYCQGRVKSWGEKQQHTADIIYAQLKKLSNNRLTGHADSMQNNTFWFIKESQ